MHRCFRFLLFSIGILFMYYTFEKYRIQIWRCKRPHVLNQLITIYETKIDLTLSISEPKPIDIEILPLVSLSVPIRYLFVLDFTRMSLPLSPYLPDHCYKNGIHIMWIGMLHLEYESDIMFFFPLLNWAEKN